MSEKMSLRFIRYDNWFADILLMERQKARVIWFSYLLFKGFLKLEKKKKNSDIFSMLALAQKYLHLKFSKRKTCVSVSFAMFRLASKVFCLQRRRTHARHNLFKLNTRFLGNESVHATILGFSEKDQNCFNKTLAFASSCF